MKIIAIIGARGGSKSIPRKNIQPLLDKPLIGWILEEAKKSKLVHRVLVSTDDEEIAEIAKSFGAEAPFLRPKEISGDHATDVEFLCHALLWLKRHEGYEPDIVVHLSATVPSNTAYYIDKAIQTLIDTPDADAVRPIVEASHHPYKMWSIDPDKKWLVPFIPEKETGFSEAYNLPRQLFPNAYNQTGAMHIMRLATIRDMKSTSGKKLAYIVMKPEDVVDIDSPTDFAIAEFLLKRRKK